MREVIQNAIIGGGPAGSALAIQLARRGQQVTLFERKDKPHNKVCGEFISWEANAYLEALGLDLAALGALPVRRLRLIQSHQLLEAPLPFTAWSLSRRTLDNELLKLAQHSGADVYCNTPVRSLARRGGGWQLEASNAERLEAQHCFLASGKYDLPGWRRPRPDKAQVGLKMHLKLSRAANERLREVVEVHFFPGGYAGLEAIEGGKVNLCLLIDKAIYAACNNNWASLMNWLAARSAHMKARLTNASSLWPRPLAVSGIPYGYIYGMRANIREEDDGLYRLGDQLAVIPSFAGDGIAIALHSAFLAARCRQAGMNADSFHQQAAQQLQPAVRNAQILSRLFDSVAGRALVVPLGRSFPSLLQGAITHTRVQPLLAGPRVSAPR